MALVNQQENVVICNPRPRFCCRFKFVDCRRNDGVRGILQQCNQAAPGGGFHRIKAGVDKVVPQLFDQIQSVAHQNKSCTCSRRVCKHSFNQHDHGKGLAAALRMPDDAAARRAAVLSADSAHGVLHAEELLIAGNLFDATVIKDIEPNQIQQPLLGEH